MKNLNLLILGILLISLNSSCDKEESNDNLTLIGNWTYSEDYSKTFDFKNSTEVLINGHDFLYQIVGDSIEFSYNGELYIAIRPSKHRIEKLSDTDYLMIEDLDNLQFFNGSSGENILLCCVEQNNFIGTWISENDTLIFKTNDRFERKNEIYEYNYTIDSLTIQIISADIFIGSLKSKYLMDMDSLWIDYSADYYPDIQKGVLKYFKNSLPQLISDEDDECENIVLITESLENLYGCLDTRYGLDCELEDDYEIIRNQESFLDFTTGTCRPEIDFKTYDLIVGKKGVTSGNSSIEYEFIEDCQKGIKTLTVTFRQDISTVALNLTFHALVPKLGDEETINVIIDVKL